MVTKLNKLNCDKTQKTQIVMVGIVRVVTVVVRVTSFNKNNQLHTLFSNNNLTHPKPMRFLRAAFCDLTMFFLYPFP